MNISITAPISPTYRAFLRQNEFAMEMMFVRAQHAQHFTAESRGLLVFASLDDPRGVRRRGRIRRARTGSDRAGRHGPAERKVTRMESAFRPVAMCTHAFTHRRWTSNPAHRRYMTSIPLPPVSRSAGVESAGTESRRRAYRPEPVSQYGVLAGLRVKLVYGLSRTKAEPTSVPASCVITVPLTVSFMRGSGTAGWRTCLKG